MEAANNKPRRFRFSTSRSLVAIGVVAIAFVIARLSGGIGYLVWLLVSIPIAVLVLIARNDDAGAKWSVASSAIGVFVGFMACPMVHPPYEPGDEFRYMIGGAVVGWIVGVTIHHLTTDKSHDDTN